MPLLFGSNLAIKCVRMGERIEKHNSFPSECRPFVKIALHRNGKYFVDKKKSLFLKTFSLLYIKYDLELFLTNDQKYTVNLPSSAS